MKSIEWNIIIKNKYFYVQSYIFSHKFYKFILCYIYGYTFPTSIHFLFFFLNFASTLLYDFTSIYVFPIPCNIAHKKRVLYFKDKKTSFIFESIVI